MTEVIQRAFPRINFKAPIQYGVPNGKNSPHFLRSRTINYSAGGFCYMTDQQLNPEDEVCIIMSNYTPGRTGPECYRSYLTRIRWTQPVHGRHKSRYASGARIIARSHEVLDVFDEEAKDSCDMCGASMPVNCLQCDDKKTQLCEQCHSHFQALPEGKIRQCVARFMTGNVV